MNTNATQAQNKSRARNKRTLFITTAMLAAIVLRSPRRVPDRAQSYNRKWQRLSNQLPKTSRNYTSINGKKQRNSH